MPWPVRWMNVVAEPGLDDQRAGNGVDRAARRSRRGGGHGRGLRFFQYGVELEKFRGGSPVNTVRVMSEQYPPIVPPKSQTTASPAPTSREPASWWGLAEFGPLPTIAKFTR